MINDHNCSQICIEEEGSFSCSCFPGYELQDDLATCEGNNVLHAYANKYVPLSLKILFILHTYFIIAIINTYKNITVGIHLTDIYKFVRICYQALQASIAMGVDMTLITQAHATTTMCIR